MATGGLLAPGRKLPGHLFRGGGLVLRAMILY